MKKSLQKEIKQLIKRLSLNCTIKEFSGFVDWVDISETQELSEDFIREFKDRVIWGIVSLYQKLSEEFIREFNVKIYWECISRSQKLSESFIREFKDKLDWYQISQYQKLSESFIREFNFKVNWSYISNHQKLSEDFIREFKDKVSWTNISECQKLSEGFIREFQDKVNWYKVSQYQKLSESFIREFMNRMRWDNIYSYQKLSEDFIRKFFNVGAKDIKIQKSNHKEKSLEQKTKEIKAYAKRHHLKFDGKFLHAFRNHDFNGCGLFNKTIVYEKGKYYRDWRCNMNPSNENSFGLGIFPKGNTKIKVKVEDWGVEVNRNDGKARVWGITIGGATK